MLKYVHGSIDKVEAAFGKIYLSMHGKNGFMYPVFYNATAINSGDTVEKQVESIYALMGYWANKYRDDVYKKNLSLMTDIKNFNSEIYNSEKLVSTILPNYTPVVEDLKNRNLAIGGDVTGLNLNYGYDQASWALGGDTNGGKHSEALINEYVNEKDSMIGSIWLIDKDGNRQRIYDEGLNASEIANKYGVTLDKLVFDIVRKSDGEHQAWISYNQLIGIKNMSSQDAANNQVEIENPEKFTNILKNVDSLGEEFKNYIEENKKNPLLKKEDIYKTLCDTYGINYEDAKNSGDTEKYIIDYANNAGNEVRKYITDNRKNGVSDDKIKEILKNLDN